MKEMIVKVEGRLASTGDDDDPAQPGWSLSVCSSTVLLSVRSARSERGCDNVTLQTGSIDQLVLRWAALRPLYGWGPLPQDMRDAYAACRRELDLLTAAEEQSGSRLEAFGDLVGAGVDPDAAARAVGGTGRPEVRSNG